VQVAYQLSFWAIVITILLNVIFGIIIDTFGELRSDTLAKKHDMENACFVCGVDRFTLDTKGGGFERHIKEDHYMWNYLYLIVHLREKPPTEYHGCDPNPNPNPSPNPNPNPNQALTASSAAPYVRTAWPVLVAGKPGVPPSKVD